MQERKLVVERAIKLVYMYFSLLIRARPPHAYEICFIKSTTLQARLIVE